MKIVKTPLIIFLALTLVSFDIPSGWGKAGSKRDSYDMGIEINAGKGGGNAATIKSIHKKIRGFGTLMQTIKVGTYAGKRLKLTGYLKTANVNSWAGMWMRVDGVGSSQVFSFDNMGDRPLKGTTDWKKCEIVLDVPTAAEDIAFGVLLNGTGQVWLDDFSFEVVSKEVPITGNNKPWTEPNDTPTNLNFDN